MNGDNFSLYLRKLHARGFIVGHLIEDDEHSWSILIHRKGSFGPGNCTSANGKTPDAALKNAYRKLWPAKGKKK